MKNSRLEPITELFFLLVLSGWALPTFANAGQLTRVATGELQLALRRSADGIRIDRLLDARSGQELLATNPPPLFSFTLRQTGSTNPMNLAADSGWTQCGIRQRGARFELRWSHPAEHALAGLAVTATVAPTPRAGCAT